MHTILTLVVSISLCSQTYLLHWYFILRFFSYRQLSRNSFVATCWLWLEPICKHFRSWPQTTADIRRSPYFLLTQLSESGRFVRVVRSCHSSLYLVLTYHTDDALWCPFKLLMLCVLLDNSQHSDSALLFEADENLAQNPEPISKHQVLLHSEQSTTHKYVLTRKIKSTT